MTNEEKVNSVQNKVTENRGIVNFLYDFGILDFWDQWENVFVNSSPFDCSEFLSVHMKPLTPSTFVFLSSFFAKIGDRYEEFRRDSECYLQVFGANKVGNEIGEDIFMVGIKFNNNGRTLIGSNIKLPIEVIDEICLTDIWADGKHVKML